MEDIRRNLYWLGMDGLFPLTNSIMNYINNSYKWFNVLVCSDTKGELN